jgi:diguanylate cyclase (GGDEF)-like protein
MINSPGTSTAIKNNSSGLQSNFTPLGMWAFSIGTSIGWGSFIVTCSAYLQKAGILGTVFGLLIGMAVVLVITWNLQYMIKNSPDAGGIYTFERKVGGKDLGFVAAWFVLLTYLAIFWANITSVPLFARFFLGDTFSFGFHYNVFGYEVWLGEALLSIGAVLVIGFICSRSSKIINAVMIVAALAFAIGFTVCAIAAIVKHESAFSYSPNYAEGSKAFAQIVRIAAISPWAFIGFENISHFSQEYKFPVKKIKGILISSVVITTALYILVSLLSISAYPPEYNSWIEYIGDMGNLSGIKAVPAFYAAQHYLGNAGITILMFALFGVILTSLFGNMLALSRLLYATGREGDAPKAFEKLNNRGIPSKAIWAIVCLSIFIPFLGRTAIGWIVDVTTLGATVIYGLISHAVFKHARQNKAKFEKATGIIGAAIMACFLLLLLIPGLLPFHAMETESYILFIVWAVVGLIYFHFLIKKDRKRSYAQQRVVVWIILLVMILFASMMWVSRATEKAAETAAENIYSYHQSHPDHDTNEAAEEQREEFLLQQENHVAKINTLYTIVSLGLFIISMAVILTNYKETRELDEKLTAAEDAAKAAQQIADLRASLTALLNNMPAMSFSKDAKTGVYRACNQAFAEYALKSSPEGVIGLTDNDIFDEATAKHFREDDRMALSLERPYVFFEDVPDPQGNLMHFQTTKLKYIDDTGCVCILGMCEDITEKVHMQIENESTREAYEKSISAGLIYSRLAQTLARSYTNLFYVNLETAEYIEYKTDEESNFLSEARHGEDFFEALMKFAEESVYFKDRESFKEAMQPETLIDNITKNKTFIKTFRIITYNNPKYVTMKVSRMEDDENFIIMGITDVDAQVRQQKLAERLSEERIAYNRLKSLIGDFLSIFVVIPETGQYRMYSSTADFDSFNLPKEGLDFFNKSRELAKGAVYEDDIDRYLSLFTEEGVLSEIEKNGIFSMTYRLVIGNNPIYVQLRAAMVDEIEGRRLVVGINDIDSYVRQEKEYEARLAQAQIKANVDALTGVRNRHAYLDAEEHLDRMVAEELHPEFAITIFDVNNLKDINDSEGHTAGDQYLKNACKIICDIFKHSQVYRVGGDEFAVISQNEDYENIEALINQVNEHNANAKASKGIVIACGMAKFENDACVATVFERADQNMYKNKGELKNA